MFISIFVLIFIFKLANEDDGSMDKTSPSSSRSSVSAQSSSPSSTSEQRKRMHLDDANLTSPDNQRPLLTPTITSDDVVSDPIIRTFRRDEETDDGYSGLYFYVYYLSFINY